MCCYRITREREKKDKTQSSFTKNTRSEKRYKKTIKTEANLNLREQKIFMMISPQVLFLLVIEKIKNLMEWDQEL